MKVKCIVDNINCEMYTVYGILMRKGSLSYLLMDHPSWYPAEQLEIVNKLLPLNWYFNFNNKTGTAIWGYKELVFDENHYEALVEREKDAVEIFERRREEIEEFESLVKFE